MHTSHPLFIRETIIRSVRDYFYQQNFHEIITPVLNNSVPLEPNLYPFTTTWNSLSLKKTLYLSLSPERGIKHLLAQGIGNCFAIGKSFRNLEDAGTLHIPEFLMLEWYREQADYQDIMNDASKLIVYIKKELDAYEKKTHSTMLTFQNLSIDLTAPWQIVSLSDLFFEYGHLNYEQIICSDKEMKSQAKKKGYDTHNASWQELFDQIFVNEIESKLPKNPFFLVDFPSRISPLCKPMKEKPFLAERFELYIAGMELGNGNNENTDYRSIQNVFTEEYKAREKKGLPVQSIDEVFLHDLKIMSKKSYAGIGLGIDRLSMLFSGKADIKDLGIL